MPSASSRTVCVTGAGGFIASWLVKLLLEKGYIVRGTVRNPGKNSYNYNDDPKNSHLRNLEGAEERLTLCKADLLDFESLGRAIDGCDGVFHTAAPLSDDPEEVLEPIVIGTKNVIVAAAEAKNWYCYGKAVAEQVAWDEAKQRGMDLVVVNPVVVTGPLLQPTLNASTLHILKYLNGSAKTYANLVQGYVHVKDVALAHILVFETPSASGRYICAESVLHRGDVVKILAKLFPQYPIPTKCKDETNPRAKPYKLSTKKLTDLGLEFTTVEQSLYEAVKSLQDNGQLPIPTKIEDHASFI
ncbi:hypothetical protein Vadar_030338 [Vaccinium darrowii]|uniref:Uncharacterized protein n=1 Tax=Vaccinium darrowii TaxID=229202 RepID=A0ACB7Z096_9ERIC|nr:hypothetical protein Vadar_030338 [Vaccinium darrowii]